MIQIYKIEEGDIGQGSRQDEEMKSRISVIVEELKALPTVIVKFQSENLSPIHFHTNRHCDNFVRVLLLCMDYLVPSIHLYPIKFKAYIRVYPSNVL